MNISNNINSIKNIIKQNEITENRQPDSVLLLAVSKQQPVEAIIEAYRLGIKDFGESYFQEAERKITQLQDLPICWHFIGPVQSNKTKGIASLFSWVHSVSRIKIAQLLSEFRPLHLPPLNVCLQINLTTEETKSGISSEQAIELAQGVSQLPHIKLRGLMTILPLNSTDHEQYRLFRQLNHLLHAINKEVDLAMDTLSMGMSNDLIPAIKAGSTIVRIGRGIFGERQGKRSIR